MYAWKHSSVARSGQKPRRWRDEPWAANLSDDLHHRHTQKTHSCESVPLLLRRLCRIRPAFDFLAIRRSVAIKIPITRIRGRRVEAKPYLTLGRKLVAVEIAEAVINSLPEPSAGALDGLLGVPSWVLQFLT